MKSIVVSVATCLTLMRLGVGASAQSYSIDWHTIDGGGGASAGGGFSVSGTIGQPDASGALTGGSFSITGGFWSAVQSEGAPSLRIHLTNGSSVVVSWPSPSPGYVLQQTAALSPSNWTAPSEAVADNGTNRFITVQPPMGNRFFRLVRP